MKAIKFLIFLIVTGFIVILFCFLIYTLSYSFFNSYFSKVTPFECGFQPFSMHMFMFSFPFFLVSLLFLLFDVEILLLCFLPLLSYTYFSSVFTCLTILIILLATLYEWVKGLLNWL